MYNCTRNILKWFFRSIGFSLRPFLFRFAVFPFSFHFYLFFFNPRQSFSNKITQFSHNLYVFCTQFCQEETLWSFNRRIHMIPVAQQ